MDQSWPTDHTAPLNTHHLNCSGGVPPKAVAVNVTVLPNGCGEGLSAVRPLIDRGAGPMMVKAIVRSALFSGASVILKLLRAHTPIV